MKLEQYLELREKIVDMGYGGEVEWAQGVQPPATAEDLWREYAWVVLNSGMRNQVAESIWVKVQPEVEGGGSAHNVFGHKGKSAGIDLVWKERAAYLEGFRTTRRHLGTGGVILWCQELPWIGPTTRWHLAKNLGIDCAKPDRWLERVAAAAGEDVAGLCTRLAGASGDRIATVDLVIWRACNLGLWPP